ncbi:hypothetical protein DM01DRAFT_1332619 [Hesseltinella vesiculosa]|uniref:Sorting nexin MVP1 n=1 Tax=Hesseltinella vesiculosa TaxID=101127 RepID=A0A1X2GSK7_9FUNG|nr:hypothetical protein DM01DRAFT_1332619 [Hesseltinella vesiculosa]
MAPRTAAMVLAGITLPDAYGSLFIDVQRSGRVSLTALYRLLEQAHLSAMDIDKITQIVVPNGTSYVTRSEFNTALALIYCAQNGIDISLNALYHHRESLGVPNLTSVTPTSRIPNPLHSDIDDSLTTNASSPLVSPTGSSSTATMLTSNTSHDTNTAKPKLDTRTWFKNVEEIKVTIAPEREGFIFKHVNYIIESQKRSSIVLRRFSDFWWLMEVLNRRYPFRMLPNLPPKKLGGRDSAFLEKRRKGLSRFINAVVRHPILRSDAVVTKFLTEPTELAPWRKQHPPSLDEEFQRKQYNMDDIRAMLPNDLHDQIEKTGTGVAAAITHYINLCYIMERTIRRMHGQATDYVRYSIALNSLAESEHRYHASECRQCQLVVQGYEKVAKHMQKESSILDQQVGLSTDGVLENLKRVRDLLVSFRELMMRKERLSSNDSSDNLTKRIAATKAKLNQNKGVPGMEAEVDKLTTSLQSDEQELKDHTHRQMFIHYCIWSEMTYLHKQQTHVSTLYRQYVKEMVAFSKKRYENWHELEAPVFDMPVEMDAFE